MENEIVSSYAAKWSHGTSQIADSEINEYRERYQPALSIFGVDLITPEQIAMATGMEYSDEQYESFINTLPEEDILRELHKKCYMLVAGPAHPMDFLETCNLHPCNSLVNNGLIFFKGSSFPCGNEILKKKAGRYFDGVKLMPGIKLMEKEKVNTSWFLFPKVPIAPSWEMIWEAQLSLLSEHERAPSAAEVMWIIYAFQAMRDSHKALTFSPPLVYQKNIFSDYTLTSTMIRGDLRIFIGALSNNSIVIKAVGKNFNGKKHLRRHHIGLCPIREH